MADHTGKLVQQAQELDRLMREAADLYSYTGGDVSSNPETNNRLKAVLNDAKTTLRLLDEALGEIIKQRNYISKEVN